MPQRRAAVRRATDVRAGPAVAGWEPRYRRFVIGSDAVVTFGTALLAGAMVSVGDAQLYKDLVIGGLTVLIILCALAMSRAWHSGVLGQGSEEYVRLGRAMLAGAATLGLAGLATGVVSTRDWVFFVIPAIAGATLLCRYLLRMYLHRARSHGQCLLPVMAAGGAESMRTLIARTRVANHLGWQVAAVCTIEGNDGGPAEVDGVPVVGTLDELAAHVRRGGYRIVAVTSDPYWTPQRLQRLAWDLESSGAELVVAPTLMEVAGPRLRVSGVLGMPLLRVAAPTFTGTRRVVKGVVDRVGALLLLSLLLPAMTCAALAIRVDTPGPVFYRQRRVGKNGEEFTIVKFRTMVAGAHLRKAELTAVNEGSGLLFKLRRDPRVTHVGAFLRRFSIDELPQLFNVLTGSMSLVGPRPPLPEESARYEPDMRRRLLVKPGLTGLWQVSGRSDLPWEEAVRLDLKYVEDWSLRLDAVILWRTLQAVLSGRGAY